VAVSFKTNDIGRLSGGGGPDSWRAIGEAWRAGKGSFWPTAFRQRPVTFTETSPIVNQGNKKEELKSTWEDRKFDEFVFLIQGTFGIIVGGIMRCG
jgi:hypothetical protein